MGGLAEVIVRSRGASHPGELAEGVGQGRRADAEEAGEECRLLDQVQGHPAEHEGQLGLRLPDQHQQQHHRPEQWIVDGEHKFGATEC